MQKMKLQIRNEGWERVMEREGIGTINKNGLRLADMCALNNLEEIGIKSTM